MVFDPRGLEHLTLLAQAPLASYLKPTVLNLGLKLNIDFKLDQQLVQFKNKSQAAV